MTTENVKLKSTTVKKVRDNKKKTGVPISKFFEMAAEEKLKSNSNNEQVKGRKS